VLSEETEAEYAASQTMTFAGIASVILGVVGYLFVGDFLGFMGASPDVLPIASSYMQVISLGLLFMFGFAVFVALMRGYGDTITPMLVMFGSVVLNIIIDPFLIFGWTVVENAPLVGTIAFPELGIEGAAIATVFSRARWRWSSASRSCFAASAASRSTSVTWCPISPISAASPESASPPRSRGRDEPCR